MRAICKQLLGLLIWVFWALIWVANITLNVVAYVNEHHWSSIVMIVVCSMWLIGVIISIVAQVRNLKYLCDEYDNNLKQLIEQSKFTDSTSNQYTEVK